MIVNFLWDYTIYKPVDLFLLKQTNKSKSVQEQIGGQTTGLTFPHDETNQTDYCTLGCSTDRRSALANSLLFHSQGFYHFSASVCLMVIQFYDETLTLLSPSQDPLRKGTFSQPARFGETEQLHTNISPKYELSV